MSAFFNYLTMYFFAFFKLWLHMTKRDRAEFSENSIFVPKTVKMGQK